jgi:soluble lytic murein transglycosylase-like protein
MRAQAVPNVAVDQLRGVLRLANAEFGFREAIRNDQELLYWLAANPDLESDTIRPLGSVKPAGLSEVLQGQRARWRTAGLPDFTQSRPRFNHRFSDAEPLDALQGYYRTAAARVGIDWTYLAAINFIESDFGRNNGPSSAGAMGPMQFLPSTWREYGNDGDIMSARDSIQAAALFLARMGAPGDYDRAIYRYNNDQNYVAAVKHLAAAVRSEPAWLTRLYYWSTYG